MNLILIKSFFKKTKLLTKTQILAISDSKQYLYSNISSFKIIKNKLNNFSITLLPFLIKLKIVKTVKTLIPTITYWYLPKSLRLNKSANYFKKLKKHSTVNKNPKITLQNLLKI